MSTEDSSASRSERTFITAEPGPPVSPTVTNTLAIALAPQSEHSSTAVLGDLQRVLDQTSDERIRNVERYVRCGTVRFTRQGRSQEEISLLRIIPSCLLQDADLREDSSGITCSICLVDFADGEELRRVPCASGHLFHPKCIRDWLERSNSTCPVCRGNLDTRRPRRGKRNVANTCAEFVIRRMHVNKIDMSVSDENRRRAAQVIAQMREPAPQTKEWPTAANPGTVPEEAEEEESALVVFQQPDMHESQMQLPLKDRPCYLDLQEWSAAVTSLQNT